MENQKNDKGNNYSRMKSIELRQQAESQMKQSSFQQNQKTKTVEKIDKNKQKFLPPIQNDDYEEQFKQNTIQDVKDVEDLDMFEAQFQEQKYQKPVQQKTFTTVKEKVKQPQQIKIQQKQVPKKEVIQKQMAKTSANKFQEHQNFINEDFYQGEYENDIDNYKNIGADLDDFEAKLGIQKKTAGTKEPYQSTQKSSKDYILNQQNKTKEQDKQQEKKPIAQVSQQKNQLKSQKQPSDPKAQTQSYVQQKVNSKTQPSKTQQTQINQPKTAAKKVTQLIQNPFQKKEELEQQRLSEQIEREIIQSLEDQQILTEEQREYIQQLLDQDSDAMEQKLKQAEEQILFERMCKKNFTLMNQYLGMDVVEEVEEEHQQSESYADLHQKLNNNQTQKSQVQLQASEHLKEQEQQGKSSYSEQKSEDYKEKNKQESDTIQVKQFISKKEIKVSEEQSNSSFETESQNNQVENQDPEQAIKEKLKQLRKIKSSQNKRKPPLQVQQIVEDNNKQNQLQMQNQKPRIINQIKTSAIRKVQQTRQGSSLSQAEPKRRNMSANQQTPQERITKKDPISPQDIKSIPRQNNQEVITLSQVKQYKAPVQQKVQNQQEVMPTQTNQRSHSYQQYKRSQLEESKAKQGIQFPQNQISPQSQTVTNQKSINIPTQTLKQYKPQGQKQEEGSVTKYNKGIEQKYKEDIQLGRKQGTF